MDIDKELSFIAREILAVHWEKFDSDAEKQGWRRKSLDGGYEYRYQDSDPNISPVHPLESEDYNQRTESAWEEFSLVEQTYEKLREKAEDFPYWSIPLHLKLQLESIVEAKSALAHRVNFEAANAPAHLSFSKNNPHQTERFIEGHGTPLILKDMKSGAIEDWVLTSENQIILNSVAGAVYGRNPFDDWKRIIDETIDHIEFTANTEPSEVPSEIILAHRAVRDAILNGDADEKILKAWDKINFIMLTDWRRGRNEIDQIFETIKPEFIQMVKDKTFEIVKKQFKNILDRAFDPNFVNPEAMKNIFLELQKEAKDTLPAKPIPVFRGLKMSSSKKAFIQKEIEEKGFYDLPVPPVQSYSRSERIATAFAKYGQGGKYSQAQETTGCVISSVLTKDNVWLHDRQPSWRTYMVEAIAKGLTFNIGGSDQKEVLVGHPEKTIRLTKENMKWI